MPSKISVFGSLSPSLTEDNGRFDLVCLSGDECNAPFAREELQKFLDPENFTLFDRIRSRYEFEKVQFVPLWD